MGNLRPLLLKGGVLTKLVNTVIQHFNHHTQYPAERQNGIDIVVQKVVKTAEPDIIVTPDTKIKDLQ